MYGQSPRAVPTIIVGQYCRGRAPTALVYVQVKRDYRPSLALFIRVVALLALNILALMFKALLVAQELIT